MKLNFFRRNKCPVNNTEKEWIESNLIWLISQFGYERLLSQEILTSKTLKLVEAISHSSIHDLDFIVRYTCNQMNVNHEIINIDFYSEQKDVELAPNLSIRKTKGAAGLYDNSLGQTISLEKSDFNDPFSQIATLAHELGHVKLLGEGRVSSDEEDHELLTDLTATFFGFGILCANSSFQFKNFSNGWQSRRKGYMSLPMYSYSLALLTICRNEFEPAWRNSLNYNGKSWFDQTMRYIKETHNTPFYPFYQPFDENFVPIDSTIIQERLKLSASLEDFDYSSALKSFINEKGKNE